MGYVPANPKKLANNVSLANTANAFVTLYGDYSQNKPITTDAISAIQDVASLTDNPFLNGTLIQTESVTLMQSLYTLESGSGATQDLANFANVLSNLGSLVNTVGTVTDNPEVSLAGALISAYGDALTTTENWSSNTDWASTLQSLSDLINNGINNVVQGGNTLSDIISNLIGNTQQQIIDPLVISTNGQAVTTTSLANGTFVDYQNTGFEEQSSWFSPNAGILVDVTNANGTLNNGFTIIGTDTTNQNGNTQGQAGFTQLASMDTNHDGVINASDTDFNQIEILVGSNGQPGSGHLETLAQAGITSISLNTTAVNTTDTNGDKTLTTSSVTYSNGTTGTLSDMSMSVNTSNTVDESAGMTNSAYSNLPDVAGWGDVHNLQVAMALDTTGNLANLVKQYLAATPSQQATLINNLIFTWTGVVNNPQENTYHFTGDTREIDALSKFVGAQYSNDSGWSTTLVTAAGVPILESAWTQLTSYVSSCLTNYQMNQTLLTDAALTYNSTTQSFSYDVAGLVNAMSGLSYSQLSAFGEFLAGSNKYNGIISALNSYFQNPSTPFQTLICSRQPIYGSRIRAAGNSCPSRHWKT